MGLYNTIECECPTCGNQYGGQSKVIGESLLYCLSVGDDIPGGEEDTRLLMADECLACGARIVVTVKDNKIHNVEAWDGKEEIPCPDGERRKMLWDVIDQADRDAQKLKPYDE